MNTRTSGPTTGEEGAHRHERGVCRDTGHGHVDFDAYFGDRQAERADLQWGEV